MGGTQSSEITSVMDVLQENVTNILNSNKAQVKATAQNINSIKLIFKGRVKNCSLGAIQSIKASQGIKAAASLSSAADISNVMSQAIDQTIKQNQAIVNDFLSTTFSNQESKQNISNKLQSIIKTNVTNESVADILQISKNLNNLEYIFYKDVDCTEGGDVKNTQSIVADQVAEAISNSIGEILLKNDSNIKAKVDASSKQEAESKGLSSLVGALLSPYAMIIVIVLAVVFIFSSKVTSTVSNPKKLIMVVVSAVIIVAIFYGIKAAISKDDKKEKKDDKEYFVYENYYYCC